MPGHVSSVSKAFSAVLCISVYSVCLFICVCVSTRLNNNSSYRAIRPGTVDSLGRTTRRLFWSPEFKDQRSRS